MDNELIDDKEKKQDDSSVIGDNNNIVNDDDNQINDLNNVIEQLQKTNEEYLFGWKRAKADYANLENQFVKRLNNAVEAESGSIIMSFLSIYEAFEKSMEHFSTTSEEVQNGINSLKNEFWKVFQNLGVEQIDVSGVFDPHVHEVLMKQKKEGVESGVIIQEVSKGYKLNNKLLKPAKVIVAE